LGENRVGPLKAKTNTTNAVAPKPALRPRAALGDLTKKTAVSSNQVQPSDDKLIKKPGAAPKQTQQTNT